MYRSAIKQLGEAGINLFKALWYIVRGKINWHEVALQIVKTGIGSLFIVAITSFFVGFVLALQMAKALMDYGAENYLGAAISTTAIRELGPIISAVVVSGRVGTAISAEIGSMKSSEQIDALIVLGIDPVRYLIVPRLLSSAIITPLLSSLSTFLIIISGMILANAAINVNFDVYMDTVRTANTMTDIFVMLLKGCIFGIVIAIVATTAGLQVKGGSEAVGNATIKTAVWDFILIFILNYFISSCFFRL